MSSWLRERRRWLVVALLFFLSTINYLDRQALSVLAPTLREQLRFTVEEYSYVVTAFLVAYTIGFVFCGRVLDRFGARAGIAFAIAFWSVAAGLHAAANSWRQLAACRFLLGLGESFNAPGGAKVIREWIPKNERGLSMAVFSTGNIAGAILAPPLVGFLALRFDWRPAFLITAATGLVWLFVWLKFYRPPERPPEGGSGPVHARSAVARHPLTAGFIAARFLTDSLPYFFSFWLPEYLRTTHNFGLKDIAMLAWIPYLAADLGGIAGGASSDWLVRRGWTPAAARRRILLVAACTTPLAAVAVRVESPMLALLCIGAVLAAHSAWITNLLTVMTESMPPTVSGQVVGWSGVGGSLGGIVSNLATGRVVAAYGYRPVFTALAFLHISAFAVLAWMNRGSDQNTNRAPN